MLNRIQMSDTDGTNIYTFPINPSNFNPQDNSDYNLVETLDGSSIRITSSFDNRVRTMTWPAYPVTNSNFMALVSELSSYVGQNKKLYLGDVDDAFSYGWRYIKVIDVKTTLNSGGKLMKTLEMSYIYTESY